jgi:hypothetical protein
MSRWFQTLIGDIGRKLSELRELLETPIAPQPELVPIPVRPSRPPRR